MEEGVVTQVILKVAQRCNLDCTYCYVYNRGDDSWKDRPAYVSDRVARQLGRRVRAHCDQHGLPAFTIELHGGEPLLLGRRRMQRVLDTLRREAAPVSLRVVMQTNATLLDEAWLALLVDNDIRFGISLDGPPSAADRRRVTRGRGEGSTQRVIDAVRRLRAAGPAFDRLCGGFLCVIDPRTDGGEIVRWFAQGGFTPLDLLLPDGNRVNLPQDWIGVEPYQRFLLQAFEQWAVMTEDAPRIRLFDLMLTGLMGGQVTLDALGGDLRRVCVVESDGSIGVTDTARICGGEYAHDALNIFDHALDARAGAYELAALQQPCATCQRCPRLAGCGGGYLPHRYDGVTFANPSLYCDALYALADRMVSLLRQQLPPQVWTVAAPVGR